MPFEEIDGRIIILIVFLLISAANWFLEKIKGNQKTEHEVSESFEELYDDFRDEIRQRQTKSRERRAEAHTPAVPSPPPLPQAPFHSPPPAVVEHPKASTRKPQITQISAAQKAAASRFQSRFAPKPKSTPPNFVRKMLANPQSARQAIVLTEILGKPKSLKGTGS